MAERITIVTSCVLTQLVDGVPIGSVVLEPGCYVVERRQHPWTQGGAPWYVIQYDRYSVGAAIGYVQYHIEPSIPS